jgi:transposase
MKTYRPYEPDQMLLLPPSIKEWLPAGHLAHFISETVERLDLNAIRSAYEREARGYPPYHPVMMTKVWLYAYSVGFTSSRKVERLLVEDVGFRMLAANNRPDFRTLADFRKRHLVALAGLFLQVLKLCRKAGLVKLGHVAIDSSKMKANASKHKAMSYARMNDEVERLKKDIRKWFEEADRVDAEEDALYGPDKRGDELPEELRDAEKRKKKIEEALKELEREAKEESKKRRQKIEAMRQEDRKAARNMKKLPSTPRAGAQKNFTDPDSRIMPASGEKTSFIQAYNCQAAVDGQAQVIVAVDVTQSTTDYDFAVPMVEQVKANMGKLPRKATMDAGYFSAKTVRELEALRVDPYISPDRHKHGQAIPAVSRGRIPRGLSAKDLMHRKLRTKRGRVVYAMRKAIVEPVFGQIKQARGLRQFLLRGLAKVKAEWTLICATHNLLKLWRAKSAKAAFQAA